MQKSCLIFIFLCVTFIINSQNHNYSLEYCWKLLSENKHTECVIECERVLFYSGSPEDQKNALFIKGLSLKQQLDFNKAADTFNQIRITSSESTFFNEKFYEQSLCNYLAGDFENALTNINQYEYLSHGDTIPNEILLVKILSLNSLFHFEDAKNATLALITNNNLNSELINSTENLFRRKNCPRKKNPEKAKNLSMIVPGLGHIYAGRWVEGGISFVLNAGALSFGLYNIYIEYYFTGYVIGFTLLNKFHSGGMKRSYILAETKNKRNIVNFNQHFLELWRQIAHAD
ncbi:hypothetical protein [Saccharicrinis fermentans]|uniref:Tetratricopeptide repeat protein n=1 Tax=Saccharicrinis fermentans DSM 9555 = JCM 21142 TaxID=869213 RepID=W7YMJ9_9BACT|nr:hypothetical protein [Saccharicrinis fermentans]GAF05901.1 hypothetical protein JCM21142_124660 [Saccharicrinis fermentans DSM 9555 = JCM 21142]